MSGQPIGVACRCGGVRRDGKCDRCGTSWSSKEGRSKWAWMYATTAWQSMRIAVLSEESLCRACDAAGLTESAIDVDHIVDHRGDWGLFLDRENLQPLCKSCHGAKTRAGRATGGGQIVPNGNRT